METDGFLTLPGLPRQVFLAPSPSPDPAQPSQDSVETISLLKLAPVQWTNHIPYEVLLVKA